jgi:hypothetical protein
MANLSATLIRTVQHRSLVVCALVGVLAGLAAASRAESTPLVSSMWGIGQVGVVAVVYLVLRGPLELRDVDAQFDASSA